MSDSTIMPLFRRFEGLGRKDQSAILERLSDEERAALEAAIATSKRAAAEETQRMRASDRQYLGYSAWLASLVEASVNEREVPLTRAARSALVTEHRASLEHMAIPAQTGWRAVIGKLQEFLAPTEGASR